VVDEHLSRDSARLEMAEGRRDRHSESDRPSALIARLRGVTWRWRDDAPASAKAQPGIGVIAQDVERVFPELVKTDFRGRKSVHYVGLIGPLIEAVKELDARVQALEARLEEKQRPRT
jgi:Chaperone of endosialidase